MCTLKLNQRVYGAYASDGLRAVENLLKSMLKGLRVKVSGVWMGFGGWVEASLMGLDLDVAASLLSESIGVLPKSGKEVFQGSLLKGRIVALTLNGLYVDVGLEKPVVRVSMNTLRAQVLDSLSRSMESLEGFYLLHREFPVELYVDRVDSELAECRLSWRWLSWVEGLTLSGLNLIYLIGVTLRRLKSILRRLAAGGVAMSVLRLGVLEHLLTLDPLADLDKICLNLERLLQPPLLRVLKPSKSVRELPYALQNQVRFRSSPPFKI